MRSFAEEVAGSSAADIAIFRTIVDRDFVLVHSRYERLTSSSAPLLAMDLFRYKDGKIVEHWGRQEPESSARNLGGHTQVDGPTAIEDRDKTEVNRALIQTYRDTVTVLNITIGLTTSWPRTITNMQSGSAMASSE
jgi:hypothetical protein